MKKKNKKLITLMLAGVLCGSCIVGGAVMLDKSVKTSAAELEKEVADIFDGYDKTGASDDTIVTSKKVNDTDETETTAFVLPAGGKAQFTRDLAFKWYEGKDDAKYLTVNFAFDSLDFDSVTFTTESVSAFATKDDKAVNAVKFEVKEGKTYAYVVNGDETVADEAKKEISLSAKEDIVLSLTEDGDTAEGEFNVTVNGVEIGSFTNVGENHAEYELSENYPLTIEAGDKAATVYLNEINGQKFDNITDKKIKDTAAPVLVVNDPVNGMELGSAFSLDYVLIDVVQSGSLDNYATKEYYQWNPADTETSYKTLSTSVYFHDTVYYTDGTSYSKEAKDGYKATSVKFENDGKEFVSIKFTLGDEAYNATSGTYAKKTYDLSWYVQNTEFVAEKTIGETKSPYIVLEVNDTKPVYKHLTVNETDKKNDVSDQTAFDAAVENFQTALEAKATTVSAGSNAEITFPTMEYLIDDDNGYSDLSFTICYKTPSSTNKTSSGKTANQLKLSITEAGEYEFKIIASDKAGNAMEYYDEDGKLVTVTSSNVWDIPEIPSFRFTVNKRALSVDDDKASKRKDTKILNETYTLSDFTIVGASSDQGSAYALYKVDMSAYNANITADKDRITQSVLASVSYKDINSAVQAKLGGTDDYFELYKNAYAELIAVQIDGKAEDVAKCFTRIEAYNDRITEDDEEWDKYNKYEWQKSSDTSFSTAEEGEYLIFADYWDEELPSVRRAAAYKLIVVESEADVIKGETQWLKNNIVSVVLFAIAGVMLVLIIILLLIKPSDETLEDVDAKAAAKKKASPKKKNK